MKNCIFIAAFLSLALSTQAQDLVKKTDGTVIKGKVISFQNNRLVVMQEDETEMTLPRKAVAEIKFVVKDLLSATSNLYVFPPENDPARFTNHSRNNNLTVRVDKGVSEEPYFFANRDKKHAAVILPAARPPILAISAKLLSNRGW